MSLNVLLIFHKLWIFLSEQSYCPGWYFRKRAQNENDSEIQSSELTLAFGSGRKDPPWQ